MNAIQQKLNVIEWLTDYKGSFYDNPQIKIVEIVHKKGFKSYLFSSQTEKNLSAKMDNFIDRKLSVIHKNRG